MPPKKDAGPSKWELIRERDALLARSQELAVLVEAQASKVGSMGHGKAGIVMQIAGLEVALKEAQAANAEERAQREEALAARQEEVDSSRRARDSNAAERAQQLASGRDLRAEVERLVQAVSRAEDALASETAGNRQAEVALEENAFHVRAQLSEASRRLLKELVAVVEREAREAMQREADLAPPRNEALQDTLVGKSAAARGAMAAFDREGSKLQVLRRDMGLLQSNRALLDQRVRALEATIAEHASVIAETLKEIAETEALAAQGAASEAQAASEAAECRHLKRRAAAARSNALSLAKQVSHQASHQASHQVLAARGASGDCGDRDEEAWAYDGEDGSDAVWSVKHGGAISHW